MPRPRIDLGQDGRSSLSAGQASRSAVAPTGAILTTGRSRRYVDAVARLDGSTTLSTAEVATLVDDIHREFADRWAAVPLGIVSHCYLGAPYEAHTLTVDGAIIEHYQAGQPLPGPLERARSLTRSTTYLAVEVYTDRLVCVHDDGTVSVLGAA